MHCPWIYSVFVVATIMMATTVLMIKASRVIMLPLSAPDVYAILKGADREDAVPEGRHIRQGIAAISGFTVGVASGVGGAIAYNLMSSPNNTMPWLSGLFGLNPPSNPAPAPSYTHEICFESRSLQDEGIGRQDSLRYTPNPSTSQTTSPTTSQTTSPNTSPTTGTTPTTTPTSTGMGDGPTCITIEKPKAKRRRRRAAIRNIAGQHLKINLD